MGRKPKIKDINPEIQTVSNRCSLYDYSESTTFGDRLKMWRVRHGLSQSQMTDRILDYYAILGKKNIVKDSMRRKYNNWENLTGPFTSIVFSLTDLIILQNIMACDFEFLLCECNAPTIETPSLVEETGLSYSSIEVLTSYNYSWLNRLLSGEEEKKKCLTLINALLSDEALLDNLMYFITAKDADMQPEHLHYTLYFNEDWKRTSSTTRLDRNAQDRARLYYLFILLDSIRSKVEKNISDYLPKDTSMYPRDGKNYQAAFGDALRKLREGKNLSVMYISGQISQYFIDNNLGCPSTDSIYRTLRNWENKTLTDEVRIQLGDLKALRAILDCSYEYLLGLTPLSDRNSAKPVDTMGLTPESFDILKKFTDPTFYPAGYGADRLHALDIIINDEKLFSELAAFVVLSDSTELDCNPGPYRSYENKYYLLPSIADRLMKHRALSLQKMKE